MYRVLLRVCMIYVNMLGIDSLTGSGYCSCHYTTFSQCHWDSQPYLWEAAFVHRQCNVIFPAKGCPIFVLSMAECSRAFTDPISMRHNVSLIRFIGDLFSVLSPHKYCSQTFRLDLYTYWSHLAGWPIAFKAKHVNNSAGVICRLQVA